MSATFRVQNVAAKPTNTVWNRVAFDIRKRFVYNCYMIRSFADKEAEHFCTTGKSRRIPTEIHQRAAMRLTQLNAATRIEDLRLSPSNQLEALRHDRSGQWSIRINDQCGFAFVSKTVTPSTLRSWTITEKRLL